MIANEKFLINEFAYFSRTTRAALHHYHKIGLLSPALRNPRTGYRYYSRAQLALCNVIHILQESGLTLDEIRECVEERTPERMVGILECRIAGIEAEIEERRRTQKFLLSLKESIRSVIGIDESKITVQLLPRQGIVLGELNDYSGGRDDYDALCGFYRFVGERYPELNMNYPVWGLFSPERILRRDWNWPDRYYFACPDGDDERPAGQYAVGYARGGYGDAGKLYGRMMRHINRNKLEICGNAYVEYPLNELCIADSADYLIRCIIAVREGE